MPGPMSNPSGVELTYKLYDEKGKVYYRTLSQLNGHERAYLASRKLLHTTKTAKKRRQRE